LGSGKIRQTPCVLFLAKIINKKILFILRRLVPSEIFDFVRDGEKFIKGVFARFRPFQPPEGFHRRESGGWEAEASWKRRW